MKTSIRARRRRLRPWTRRVIRFRLVWLALCVVIFVAVWAMWWRSFGVGSPPTAALLVAFVSGWIMRTLAGDV